MIVRLMAVLALAVPLTSCSDPEPRIPQCRSNQMLVGSSGFSDGRWDSYYCGPPVDTRTFEEIQEAEAALERIADCPELDRDSSDEVRLYDDGIKTFARLADGRPIDLVSLVRRCV